MNCPTCNGRAEVLESRRAPDRIRRRRYCTQCGERFTTIECRLEESQVVASTATATMAGQLLTQVHAVERSLVTLRERVQAAIDNAPPPPVTCETCLHWEGVRCCGLGMPDPELEGVQFAADCSTYQEVA